MAGSFLILHGWMGNAPGHWQTWLADRLREAGGDVAYPDLPNADRPRLVDWMESLRTELARPEPPRTVICHSLACMLWLHHVAAGGRADHVLLVAPPAPLAELPDFFPVPTGAVANAELWCSDNDPYCPGGAQERYGRPLGIPTRVIAGGAHLNPDAGYGAWPEVEAWCLSSGAKNGVDA